MTPAVFAEILGADRVSTDPGLCALRSEDIAGPGPAPVQAVLRPASATDLARAVKAARANGFAVMPRGGGMSYTGGYLPPPRPAVSLDLSDLNRVIEIDSDSRVVVVEAGCTWGHLYDTLSAAGFRTPFFGPLSGAVATIGGALSQNGAFFGSAAFGYAAQSVLGLELVDGRGTLHRVGAWATGRALGLRHFGPDVLGPFLGDCGAFGIKTKAVLPLIPLPAAPEFASFAFDTARDVLAAMARLADIPHLSEVWAMDRVAHTNLDAGGFSVLETAQMASDLAGGAGSLTQAARQLVSAARMRRAVLRDLAWSLHVVIEPPLAGLAAPVRDAVHAAAQAANGTEIPDTIPRVTRARPFRTIKALIGPAGERWLPCHAVFPARHAAQGLTAARTVLQAQETAMAAQGIRVTHLLAAVGRDILVEPQFFWPDSLSAFQAAHSPPAQVDPHRNAPDNPQARDLVHALRDDVSDAMLSAGGAHLQIGRHYRYLDLLPDQTRRMLAALKADLDPDGILNPGVLGLPGANTGSSG